MECWSSNSTGPLLACLHSLLLSHIPAPDEIRQQNQLGVAGDDRPSTPARMEELRGKIIAQAKKYFGVPYAKKYWAPHTPEYSSPIFLDCCGLVRQVLRDLQKEIGFRLGPWNQAYMFDTLPVTLTKEQMRPGDLVFMTGVYVNPRSKKQLHDMLHVEIWLGEGDRTIGSRWNSGKVQEFDSYKFIPKSFTREQYIFKSIDTWLMGVCQSYCPQHPWRLKTRKPNSRSVFNAGDTRRDEKANDDNNEGWEVGVASLQDVDNLEEIKSSQLSHTANEDDECGIISDDSGLVEAVSLQNVDNPEEIKSSQFSLTAKDDNECGILGVDHTLLNKALAEKSNKVCEYGTRTRSTFTSTKGWTFNHRSRITPFKNNTGHVCGKRCAQSVDRAQCHGGRPAHTTNPRQHFEVYIMKYGCINPYLESAILSGTRTDLFHNFTMGVLQEYMLANASMMIIAKFETDRQKQSEGTFVKLPKWSNHDEKVSSHGKASVEKADQVQRAEVDCGIQKVNYIAARRQSQPPSVVTAAVHPNSRFQDTQGRVSCVASIALRASSTERQPITAGGTSLNMDTRQGVVGLHKLDSCDKKQQHSYTEVVDNASPGFRIEDKPSAMAGYSLNTSSCHLRSHGTLYNLPGHDVTLISTFCSKGINSSYEGWKSPGLTSNKTCKSRNLSSFRELDKMMTSRKTSFARNIPSRMRRSGKFLSSRIRYKTSNWQAKMRGQVRNVPLRMKYMVTNWHAGMSGQVRNVPLRMKYMVTNWHAGMSGQVRNVPARMRVKARNLPSKTRGEFKAYLTSTIIGRARNLLCTTPYGCRCMHTCLVNQHEWSNLALTSSLQLSKDCDKSEAGKAVDAESKQMVILSLDSGRVSEIDTSMDVFAALGQGTDIFESVQMQLHAVDNVSDTSADCPIYIGEHPSVVYGKRTPGVHSNKSLLNAKNNIHQYDFLSTLEKAYLNITQCAACPDFSWAHRNQTVSEQMQQLSFGKQGGEFGNMNNNSSKDWCADFTDSGNPGSDDTCQIKLTSELERMSKLSPQNLRKQVKMTSDISKQRTVEGELTECPAICLKETQRSKGVDTACLPTNEKQRGQSVQAAEDTGLSANGQGKNASENVWDHRLGAFGEALESVDQMYREMEDSSRRVARYVLNQLPRPADDAVSCDSDSQSHSKDMLSLTNCSHYSSTVVTEDIDTICPPLEIINDIGAVENKGRCKVKTKDKKPDTSLGLNVLEDLGDTAIDLYAFCSVDNLNEISTQNNATPHSTRISQELSQYLSQDTTSNDGGDDDDIDDNQIDEDDELKYFDAEKQTSRSLLQSFVRSHNDDVDDDDVDYDDFCGSMNKTSDFSGSVCHLDHKSSLFPGGGQQSQNFKIAIGSEDGNKQKQRENIGQRGADDFLKVKIQCPGGAGDSYKDSGRGGGGICRKDSRSSKLGPCCLPNNMQPTFFIGGANGISLVEGPLLALGWRRTADRYDERYKLKWVENKSRINYLTFREGEQLVNHIPNCRLLTNKLGLLCSLQEYERITLLTKGRLPRLRMADFVPETYKLDDKVDREKFIQEYTDGETWICKPTGMNQGKGIFLLRSKEKVDQLLGERDPKLNPKCNSRGLMMRIVQRYISHPLLLEGRKFDIRSYMFIASTVPFLVLYHKGYVRLSCHKYNPDDNNLTTHLTNQFVQKKDPSYKDSKEDTAWTMDKLNDYINEHVAKEKGIEEDWVYGKLTKQMQRITLHCFNSVKHKLQCRMGYFDLYGLDFMVDSDMKVWLIEINANPALHTNCQALKDAIPSVVEEAIHLALECFEKSCKGQPLMPLNSLAGYSVLYCGSSPNTASHRQIRSVSPFKDISIWSRSSELISYRRYQGSRAGHSSCYLPQIGSLSTASQSRQFQAYNLPRVETDSSKASSVGHVPSSKKTKRVSAMNSLPIINIGMTLELKPSTDCKNNNLNTQKLERPLLHSQEQQPQPVNDCSQADLLSDVKKQQSLTHYRPGVQKTRDNIFRGN